ncbi:MAG: signal recognition particle protein [Acidobacteria bacterium]|nr:signal recognition particle protein [Acidobacteriota bacterium]
MLDSLSAKLQRVLKDLKGEARLTETHIDAAMREIRIALLEADVNFKVVKEFVARVRGQALGQEVMASLTPGQQVVKVVRDQLTDLLGTEGRTLTFSKTPPTVILLVGLQGSGKTTTTGKLALFLQKMSRRPLMVSVDVYRPAARDQLAIIGREIKIPVYEIDSADPLMICQQALTQARNVGYDTLLVDTAGRLHIDQGLMDELKEIGRRLHPDEVLLVADSMTGQDAVQSARDFNEQIGITGVILTKMDGDTRGGAALSIKSVTGQAIKFIGIGEKYESLEPFHPDRMAGRILGMGDVLSLIEKAEETVDQESARRMLEKVQKDSFTLEDFKDQLAQIRRMGPLEQILKMFPSVGPLKGIGKMQVDEKELTAIEAIINSMTAREREHYKIINGSRRKRIARGSGCTVQQVNQLLRQYHQARRMMRQMTGGMLGKRLGKLSFPF